MIGERLYQLRRSRGMSQEQLAEQIGVSRQTISKWEGGLSTPDLPKLIALADCFEVTLDVLVREENPTVTENEPTVLPSAEGSDNSVSRIQRITGLMLLLLGALGLGIAVLLLFLYPDTMASLGGSFAVTVDGSGMVYGLCILAMVTGVYLVIRKDQP